MATIINEVELSKFLLIELNESMLKAAEPILQKAIKDVEKIMRERMAARLISFIEDSFVVDRMGHDIRIMIKQASAI